MTTDSTFDGAYLVEDVAKLVHGVRSGDWVESGLSFVTGALSGLAFAVDPLGQAFAAALSWAIEHVPALKQQLMSLTGDRAALEAMAHGWDRTANSLDLEADAVRRGVRRLGEQWSGQAGAAYRGQAEGRVVQLTFAAVAARAFAVVIKAFRVFLDVCYTFVRDLIAQTFGGLGSMLTTMLGSGGIGTPLAVAQFGKTVAAVGAKVAAIVTKVTASVARLVSKYVNPLKKVISEAIAKISRTKVGSSVVKGATELGRSSESRLQELKTALAKANPGHNVMNLETDTNCVNSVVTLDLILGKRLGAVEIKAKRMHDHALDTSEVTAVQTFYGRKSHPATQESIMNELSAAGPGSRGIVFITYPGQKAGHVVMAVNTGDHAIGPQIRAVDPQWGSLLAEDINTPGVRLKFMRTDDAEIRPNAFDFVDRVR